MNYRTFLSLEKMSSFLRASQIGYIRLRRTKLKK